MQQHCIPQDPQQTIVTTLNQTPQLGRMSMTSKGHCLTQTRSKREEGRRSSGYSNRTSFTTECYEMQGKPYTLKWVDTNKGDKVSSRIIVRELKRAKTEEEKLEPNDVLSHAPGRKTCVVRDDRGSANRQTRTTFGACCVRGLESTLEFYGVCVRDVYVKSPEELHRKGFLAKLNKTMYGTQDASNVSNPSLFCSGTTKGFCHGDDFGIACSEENAEAFGPERFGALHCKKLEVKQKLVGLIGEAPRLAKQLEVLNRTVRLVDDIGTYLIEIEADLGLRKGNAVKTPRLKLDAASNAEAAAVEDSPLVDSVQATAFCSATMRAAYLGQDRVEIAETVGET
eukprot:831784-Amphidinium_carterae.1